MINFIKNILKKDKQYTEPQLLKKIDKIIKNRGDINALIDGKLSLLHIAVAGSHLKAIKKLIEVKADVNVKTLMGFMPLHSACLGPGDNFEIIKVLMENGAYAQAKTENGETPLHFASYFKDSKTGEYLSNYYNDIDILDNEYETPLHKAAFWGNREMAELLIQKGADINAESIDGMTPLHLSIFFLRHEVMEVLLNGGADPNIKNKNGETPLFILTSYILPDDEISKKKMLDMLQPRAGDAALKPESKKTENQIYKVLDGKVSDYNSFNIAKTLNIIIEDYRSKKDGKSLLKLHNSVMKFTNSDNLESFIKKMIFRERDAENAWFNILISLGCAMAEAGEKGRAEGIFKLFTEEKLKMNKYGRELPLRCLAELHNIEPECGQNRKLLVSYAGAMVKYCALKGLPHTTALSYFTNIVSFYGTEEHASDIKSAVHALIALPADMITGLGLTEEVIKKTINDILENKITLEYPVVMKECRSIIPISVIKLLLALGISGISLKGKISKLSETAIKIYRFFMESVINGYEEISTAIVQGGGAQDVNKTLWSFFQMENGNINMARLIYKETGYNEIIIEYEGFIKKCNDITELSGGVVFF